MAAEQDDYQAARQLVFSDRKEAGVRLAEKLSGLDLEVYDTLVLAIPRGGIPVACEVAAAFDAKLDIVTPRKLQYPDEPELAIGAVMHDGSTYLNQKLIEIRSVSPQYLEDEKKRQVAESMRRMEEYRDGREYPVIKGRTVVLVDDGIATGATAIVALRWLRKQGADKLIVAAPIIAQDVLATLNDEADEVRCIGAPSLFVAIGQFYTDYYQIQDSDAIRMLEDYWKKE